MSMKKMLAVVAAAALVAIAAPAFAANPFSDVPMNHWAYDAVAQLTSRGVISGYPDGTFKGNKAMTRYEIASIIARSLANAEYATKEDMERLKALVVEFQPELEALGVTVDGFDKRVSALEKGVGGWKIWGELRFDADKYDQKDTEWDSNQKWGMSRYRIWLRKEVNDKVSFTARIGNLGGSHRAIRSSADMAFDRYYIDVKDFLNWDGLTFTAGKFLFDWEDEDNMYIDDDTVYGDFTIDGMQLKKDFGMGDIRVMGGKDGQFWGARARLNFGEKGWLSLNALWDNSEKGTAATDEWKIDQDTGEIKHVLTAAKDGVQRNNYWVAAGFKFTPGIELKGSYGWQDLSGVAAGEPDDPKLWKAILDVKQDVLKFTSLWVEYQSYDAGFRAYNDSFNAFNDLGVGTATKAGHDVEVWFAKAAQKWTDKWSTWLRYANVDVDQPDADHDKVTEWGVGVVYQYTPQLSFELAYADQKYDAANKEDDNVVRFRTHLKF